MNTGIIERITDGKYFYAVISAVLGLIPILMALLCYQNEEKRKEIILFACFGGLLILIGIITALWIRLSARNLYKGKESI